MSPIVTLVVVTMLIHVGYAGSRVLASLFALHLGASPLTVGLLVALYSTFPLFIAVYAGRVSDRVGARKPMLIGASFVILGLAIPFFEPTLNGLFASAATLGSSYVFFNIASQALAGEIGEERSRTENFNLLSLGFSCSFLLGPVIVGLAIDGFGHRYAYLCLIAVVLVTLVLTATSGAKLVASRRVTATAAKRSFVDLLRLAPLRRMLIASGIVLTGWDLYYFYMPIHGHELDLSASLIGSVLGVFAAATFVVRLFLGRLTRRFGEERVLAGALLYAACVSLALPFCHHLAALIAASFLLGLGLGCCQPLTLSLTYARTAGRGGEATGMRMAVNNATHVFVPLAFGALGGALGMVPAFGVNALCLAAGAWLSLRRLNRSARLLFTAGRPI